MITVFVEWVVVLFIYLFVYSSFFIDENMFTNILYNNHYNYGLPPYLNLSQCPRYFR